MDPITMEELSKKNDKLCTSKAESLDNVTNTMIKNTGPVARSKLMEMFNNVMILGQTPDSWKEGDCLDTQKSPQTKINN